MAGSLLLAGSSHPKLAAAIAKHAGVPLGTSLFNPFPDHELSVEITDNVRNKEVFVVQTIAHKPNDYLIELLIMLDALKRAAPKQIITIIPYFGYARQDRKVSGCSPISAKLIADLLQTAGASHVLTMDLHAGQIQGFFDIPVDELHGRALLLNAAKQEGIGDCVVLAPDLGAIRLAQSYAKDLGTDFAVMDKLRHGPEQVEISAIVGEIKGRDVLLVDDLCATGQTLIQAAAAAKMAGAKKIIGACTHGLMIGKAAEALKSSPLEKLLITDTIPLESSDFGIVSTATLFGDAIKSILSGSSLNK